MFTVLDNDNRRYVRPPPSPRYVINKPYTVGETTSGTYTQVFFLHVKPKCIESVNSFRVLI